MMKAVVLEIKDGYAAVLRDDGTVTRLRNSNYSTGDVIFMKSVKYARSKLISSIAVAAAAFLLLVGVSAWAYDSPVYYVSLDIHPSMAMEVNLFERVIGLEVLNDDAKALLEDLDLQNKPVDKVIAEIVSLLASAGYLEENGNLIIAAAAKNEEKAKQLAEKLMATAEKEAEDNGAHPEIAAEALGFFMVQEAKELGITPGKLNIITNLLGEEVTADNINEPIKDLMARYTATKGVEGKEIAEGKGKPEDAGPPEGAGKPENAGKPEDAGKPENAGQPAGTGKPEGVGNPSGNGAPAGAGRP
jgi:hypothetical protein